MPYNDKYLLAFRMLFMGIVGMASVALSLLSVSSVGGMLVVKIFLASAAAYLLCGTVLMASLRFLPEKWFWTVLVLWYGLGLFLLVKNSYQPGLTLWMDDGPAASTAGGSVGSRSLLFLADKAAGLIKNQ